MLVLTRKYGQAFWIGDDVKVTVLRGKGMQVRLAIDAPKEVVVLREELRSDQKPEASDVT